MIKGKGWHGILGNKKYSSNWADDFKDYKLEDSIGWDISIVKKVEPIFCRNRNIK